MPTLADLLTFAQQASRAAGQSVTGLVDLSTMALRPLGYNVPDERIPLSTAWAERKGLLAPPDQSAAGIAGQTLGGLLAPVTAAKAPQIASGLLDEAARFQRYNQALGPAGASQAIVWHGSPRKFDAFDATAPKTTGGAFNKYGVSASDARSVAERYAKDFSGGAGYVYKVDADINKPLNLSAREFHKLQELVGEVDKLSVAKLPETKSVDLEMLMQKHGIPWNYQAGQHPIEAIRKAGFDSIRGSAGIGGAEPETLIFNPQSMRILERSGVVAPKRVPPK